MAFRSVSFHYSELHFNSVLLSIPFSFSYILFRYVLFTSRTYSIVVSVPFPSVLFRFRFAYRSISVSEPLLFCLAFVSFPFCLRYSFVFITVYQVSCFLSHFVPFLSVPYRSRHSSLPSRSRFVFVSVSLPLPFYSALFRCPSLLFCSVSVPFSFHVRFRSVSFLCCFRSISILIMLHFVLLQSASFPFCSDSFCSVSFAFRHFSVSFLFFCAVLFLFGFRTTSVSFLFYFRFRSVPSPIRLHILPVSSLYRFISVRSILVPFRFRSSLFLISIFVSSPRFCFVSGSFLSFMF